MSQAVLPLPHALEVDDIYGAGDDSWIIEQCWHEVTQHYGLPATRQPHGFDQEFHNLVEQWRRDTQFTSSVTDMVMHSAYLRIIGMGHEAIPLLLRELEQQPDHWFVALQAIAGIDPTLPDHRGRVKEMAAAWLHWGREEGYMW